MLKRYGIFIASILFFIAYTILYEQELWLYFSILFIAERIFALALQPKLDAILEEELEREPDPSDKKDTRFAYFLLILLVGLIFAGLYLLFTMPKLLLILFTGEMIDKLGNYLLNKVNTKSA